MFEVHILACKHELHAQELNSTFAKPQRALNKGMKREKQNVKERDDQRTIFPYYSVMYVRHSLKALEKERSIYFS